MATQHWDDDRLNSLANQVQGIAEIARNYATLIESNDRVIQALANTAAEAREERQQILQGIAQQQATIERQQTHIEGLRTETLRRLDLLLNQRNQQDNSADE